MISKKVFSFFVFIFFIGLISGIFFGSKLTSQKNFPKFEPTRQKGFQYISPLLYCETAPAENNDFTKNLSRDLENYITESQNNALAQNISVYFRVPDFGDWISIHEAEKYTPASLLKIPTMMVYYKEADSNPDILTKKIKFDRDNNNEMENIKPTEEMKKGEEYSVDDLINRMIINSDNNAKDLLALNINTQKFYDVFEEVGIGRLDYSETENFMDVRRYASFFRILYNASYLSRKMSEKALGLLAQVKFDKGIAAGVPQNIQVAHKFGERSYGLTDEKQLHDCGIVYAPSHPYILCVMTRGINFDALQKIIATISSKTYEAVIASKENK